MRGLSGRLLQVLAGSSYAERLQQLKLTHPAISWREVNDVETEELLQEVQDGLLELTIADSNIPEILVTGICTYEHVVSNIPHDQIPPATAWPDGCRFRPRCARAWKRCLSEPGLLPVAADHAARCWLADAPGGGAA